MSNRLLSFSHPPQVAAALRSFFFVFSFSTPGCKTGMKQLQEPIRKFTLGLIGGCLRTNPKPESQE